MGKKHSDKIGFLDQVLNNLPKSKSGRKSKNNSKTTIIPGYGVTDKTGSFRSPFPDRSSNHTLPKRHEKIKSSLRNNSSDEDLEYTPPKRIKPKDNSSCREKQRYDHHPDYGITDISEQKKKHKSHNKKTATAKSNKVKRCTGPIDKECRECNEFDQCITKNEFLTQWTRIPHYVFNKLIEASPSSRWIFLYLAKNANFKRGSSFYGKLDVTFKTISKETGISASHMRKYIDELEELRLIIHDPIQHRISGVGNITHHKIEVLFYRQLDNLLKK